jgi:hypothetical protein
MADEDLLRQAVDTAWSVYRATHNEVHGSDERRCLLERHLQQRWKAGENDAEELTCAGLAYLERLLSEAELGTTRAQAKPTTNMAEIITETRSIDLGRAPPQIRSKCLEWLSSRCV